MGGLLVLAVLFGWLFVAIRLARWLSRSVKVRDSFRPLVSLALIVFIFLLPVADELAARPYFDALCHKGAVLRINAQKIKGKDVRLTVQPLNERIEWAIVPIFRSHFVYQDAATGELLAEFETYAADGGILARTVNFGGAHPLTGTFYCAPAERASMQMRYGFAVLN